MCQKLARKHIRNKAADVVKSTLQAFKDMSTLKRNLGNILRHIKIAQRTWRARRVTTAEHLKVLDRQWEVMSIKIGNEFPQSLGRQPIDSSGYVSALSTSSQGLPPVNPPKSGSLTPTSARNSQKGAIKRQGTKGSPLSKRASSRKFFGEDDNLSQGSKSEKKGNKRNLDRKSSPVGAPQAAAAAPAAAPGNEVPPDIRQQMLRDWYLKQRQAYALAYCEYEHYEVWPTPRLTSMGQTS